MLFVCLVVVVELPEQREGDRLGNRAFLHFFFFLKKKVSGGWVLSYILSEPLELAFQKRLVQEQTVDPGA